MGNYAKLRCSRGLACKMWETFSLGAQMTCNTLPAGWEWRGFLPRLFGHPPGLKQIVKQGAPVTPPWARHGDGDRPECPRMCPSGRFKGVAVCHSPRGPSPTLKCAPGLWNVTKLSLQETEGLPHGPRPCLCPCSLGPTLSQGRLRAPREPLMCWDTPSRPNLVFDDTRTKDGVPKMKLAPGLSSSFITSGCRSGGQALVGWGGLVGGWPWHSRFCLKPGRPLPALGLRHAQPLATCGPRSG